MVRWSGRRGSNPRRSAWKADALPTELLPHTIDHSFRVLIHGSNGVVGGGFEPPKACAGRFTVCSLWPLGQPTERFKRLVRLLLGARATLLDIAELARGLEPLTSGLQNRCSTD